MRDWRVKVISQKLIGALPSTIGFKINDWLIRIARGNLIEKNSIPQRVDQSIEYFDLLHKKIFFEIEGKTIMEWGTGWCGIDLLLFHLLGAKHIHTIDHGKLLSFDFLIYLIQFFKEQNLIERITILGDRSAILRRWERIILLHENGFISLQQLLDTLGVTYYVCKSCNPTHLNILPHSIDLFYSASVLQRIPKVDLQNSIKFTSSQLLNINAVFLHALDLKDINAMSHVDSKLWRFHYLRYSDAFFNLFINSRFNSQNRLRESDFLQLFQEFDLETIYLKSFVFQSDIKKIANFPVAKRFHNKSNEDLTINASVIIGYNNSSKQATRPNLSFHRELIYQDK